MDSASLTLIAGFLPVMAASIWYRIRFVRAMAALPDAVRKTLDWDTPLLAPRTERLRHKRAVTSRLILRGLPDWVALPAAARRDLALHRGLAFLALVYLAVVPALLWNKPGMVLAIGGPVGVMLVVRAWWVGPWPEQGSAPQE